MNWNVLSDISIRKTLFFNMKYFGIKLLGEHDIINKNAPIKIGNHVWIGCRCTVLKGCIVKDDCVVTANSCLTRPVPYSNCVIGRNGDILKKNIDWVMDMPN